MSKKVPCEIFYGYAKLDSWFERQGDMLVGIGSCVTYDKHGAVVDRSVIETGIKVYDPLHSISVPS